MGEERDKGGDKEQRDRDRKEQAQEILVRFFHPCLLKLETLGVNNIIFEVYIVLCLYGLRSGFWSLMASLLCLRVKQGARCNNNVLFGRPRLKVLAKGTWYFCFLL